MKRVCAVLLTLMALTMAYAEEADVSSADAAQKTESKSNLYLDISGGFAGIAYHDQNGLSEMFTHDYSYDADGAGIIFGFKVGRIWKDAMAFYGDISYTIADGTIQGSEGCLFCHTEEIDESVEISQLSVGIGFRGFIRNPLSIMNNAYLGASLFVANYELKGSVRRHDSRLGFGFEIGKQWALGEHWLIGPGIAAKGGIEDFNFNAMLTVSRR